MSDPCPQSSLRCALNNLLFLSSLPIPVVLAISAHASSMLTRLDFADGKFVQTRRDCRQLVANCVHTADATRVGVGGVYWALVTSARRYCHQACLLVHWFVCLFVVWLNYIKRSYFPYGIIMLLLFWFFSIFYLHATATVKVMSSCCQVSQLAKLGGTRVRDSTKKTMQRYICDFVTLITLWSGL